MNRCPENSEWVLWAADEVTPDRRRELNAHRTTCEACRIESASVARGLTALAQAAPAVAPRAEAMAELRRRLAAVKAEKAARPRILTFFRQHRWAAAAAAVFIVALVAVTAIPHNPATLQVANVPTKDLLKDWPSDADMQRDLAKIAAGVELLETTDSLASVDAAPAHIVPAAPAAVEDPMMDDLDQLMEALQADSDT